MTLNISNALLQCLRQQTTQYHREDMWMIGFDRNNKENLFLVLVYPNTIYPYSVVIEDTKPKIDVDIRKGGDWQSVFHFFRENNSITFEYQNQKNSVCVELSPIVDRVFCDVQMQRNQSKEYEFFDRHCETYEQNFNSWLTDCGEQASLYRVADAISNADKETICELINNRQESEAIRMIQKITGLGLSDAKKLLDNSRIYLT